MGIREILQTRSALFYVSILALSIVNSITSLGILMLLNAVLGRSNGIFSGDYKYLMYLALIASSYVTAIFFQRLMVVSTNNIILELEMSLVEKIRKATYDSFRKLGQEKIHLALSDAWILGKTPETMIMFINALTSFIFAIYYLFSISVIGGLVIAVIILLLMVFYIVQNRKIVTILKLSRERQLQYYASLLELINGFRQVRISDKRNTTLFSDHIRKNRERFAELTSRSSKKFIVNQLTGAYSWYVLLGIIVFALPVFIPLDPTEVAAFIAAVLFIMGPFAAIVNVIPFYTQARVALERMNEVFATIQPAEDNTRAADVINQLPTITQPPPIGSIRFENIVYKYDPHNADSFCLHISELELIEGEIVFINGSNGSGKTTFVNLLTGLSPPQQGRVFVNGQHIGWQAYASVGNSMAVVFSDHHAFSDNYDSHDLSDANVTLSHWKDLFGLNSILKMNNRNGYFNIHLSKGQQKRLALLLAVLEDKPVIVLDEWAAEQDPVHRHKFYSQWLSELKKMRKTVILVSHHTSYARFADRIVTFQGGEMKHEKVVADEQSEHSML